VSAFNRRYNYRCVRVFRDSTTASATITAEATMDTVPTPYITGQNQTTRRILLLRTIDQYDASCHVGFSLQYDGKINLFPRPHFQSPCQIWCHCVHEKLSYGCLVDFN